MKITWNDYGDILCHYYECRFCANGKCHGGLYQCPHIKERAEASLLDTINDYEEAKAISQNDNSEYLCELKRLINKYKRILEDKCY